MAHVGESFSCKHIDAKLNYRFERVISKPHFVIHVHVPHLATTAKTYLNSLRNNALHISRTYNKTPGFDVTTRMQSIAFNAIIYTFDNKDTMVDTICCVLNGIVELAVTLLLFHRTNTTHISVIRKHCVLFDMTLQSTCIECVFV